MSTDPSFDDTDDVKSLAAGEGGAGPAYLQRSFGPYTLAGRRATSGRVRSATTTTLCGGSIVPSSRSRQRALARAKVERQIARRAAAARRRRQLQAGIGTAVAVVLVVVGVVWVSGGFKSKKKP